MRIKTTVCLYCGTTSQLIRKYNPGYVAGPNGEKLYCGQAGYVFEHKREFSARVGRYPCGYCAELADRVEGLRGRRLPPVADW